MPVNITHGKAQRKRQQVRNAVMAIDGIRVDQLTSAQVRLLLLAVAYKNGLVDDNLRVDLSPLNGES